MISPHENLYMPNCIRTNSGIYVDLINPHPSMIYIHDIAHSLSMQVRWNGHTSFPYTIAQHSVFVANHVERKYALRGLLHDAAEAYISDIPKPFKDLIPEIKVAERKIMQAVYTRFGLEKTLESEIEISRVDVQALENEWREFMLYGWDASVPDGGKMEFMKLFRELTMQKSTRVSYRK